MPSAYGARRELKNPHAEIPGAVRPADDHPADCPLGLVSRVANALGLLIIDDFHKFLLGGKIARFQRTLPHGENDIKGNFTERSPAFQKNRKNADEMVKNLRLGS